MDDESCDRCGRQNTPLHYTIRNRCVCSRCYDRETMDERDYIDQRREDAASELAEHFDKTELDWEASDRD